MASQLSTESLKNLFLVGASTGLQTQCVPALLLMASALQLTNYLFIVTFT